MELQFREFSVLFLVGALVLPLLLKMVRGRRGRLPPGPPKLPVIGNMHQLAGPILPHHCFGNMAKKYGPIMHLQLGEISTIVVSTPEAAREVLKTHDTAFANRPDLLLPRIMTYENSDVAWAPYGEYWRQVKRILVTELLNAKRVQTYRSIREAEMTSLVESIAAKARAGEKVNLSKDISGLMMGITAMAAFGKKSKDEEAFGAFVQQAIQLAAGFSLADLFPSTKVLHLISGIRNKVEKLVQTSDQILENIINDHIAKKETNHQNEARNEDFLDVLLKVGPTYSLTMDNIKAVILDAFLAGSQTSSTTLVWAMSELIKNPEVMEKAQAEVRKVYEGRGTVDESSLDELKYMRLVIRESLRLHPAAPMLLPRESIERCEIFGYEIPAKTRVLVNAWTIHRDPKLWKEPEKFYPERFAENSIDIKGTDFIYLPFGTGRRMCPGMSFGLANVELPLAMLLYHFDWSLPAGLSRHDLDMTEVLGTVVRRKNDLFLVPVSHACSSLK
ncbi:hypothetical protein Nepgr_021569 [Nepenthes gracilis]|uniref:Cytochrome P450 n=1 Tax=Nepenthes gracilis TaxID=150966 RepID=A0AAD3SX11_NEPGR|nr:hypothetical protein Nepgr_021569 [Nepenthes gracilis]